MSEPSSPDRPLSRPIRVSRLFIHPGVVFLSACALVWALLFLGTLDAAHGEALLVGWVALAFLAADLLLVAGLFRCGRWVEVTMEGFVVHSFRQRQPIRDDEVRDLLLGEVPDPLLTGLVPDRVRAFLTVEQQGRRSEVRLEYAPAGEKDPLAGLWKRLIRGLAQRARDQLHQPSALAGERWVVGEGRLRLLPEGRSIDLAEVRDARTIDDAACLWVGAEEAPSLRFPAGERNVRVLVRLVRLLREGADRPSTPPEQEGPLGRLICRRDALPAARLEAGLLLALVPVASFFLCLPLRAYLDGASGDDVALAFLCGGGVGLLALLGAASGVRKLRRHYPGRLAIHRGGIVLTRGGRRQALALDDIRGLTWGRPIVFRPRPGADAAALRFDGDLGDDELQRLRDRVARRLARRLLPGLREGRAVRWTDTLRFLPEGLECRERPSAPPLLVPYDGVSCGLAGATAVLRGRAVGQEYARARTDGADFFVGLALLDLLQEDDGGLPGGGPAR